jgi:DNA-binding GntR family transcriptional regulator
MKRNTRPAQTSSQRVYGHLKHDIVTCDFLPGKSLSEQELCRRYHTSRTPIREACRHLEKDGLIKIIPFRGYFVAPLTMAEYHNLNEVQLIVEPAAAALAAQRATPDQLQKIQEWAEYVYRVGNQKSYYTFLDRNYNLHVGIAAASGNESLVEIISEVHTRLMRFFYLVISVDSYGPELVSEHREIVRAIGNRDPKTARQRTAEHIVHTMQRSANLLLSSTRSQLGFLGPAPEWPGLAGPSALDWQPSSGAVETEEEEQGSRRNSR